MSNKSEVFNLAIKIEGCCISLGEIRDALYLLHEGLGEESNPRNGWDPTVVGLHLLNRYPHYHAAVHVVLKGLYQQVEDLDEATTALYDTARMEEQSVSGSGRG